MVRRCRRELTLDHANAVIAALAVVLLFACGISTVASHFRYSRVAPVIEVQVKAGDTLWALEQRYGNPDEYMPKRVQQLAARNGLNGAVRLHPGMTLQVPVENPKERTRLMTASAK